MFVIIELHGRWRGEGKENDGLENLNCDIVSPEEMGEKSPIVDFCSLFVARNPQRRPLYERACVRSHRAADNWLRVFRSVAMFIRAARSYHYFIISKKVIVHGCMAHEVKLRAGACVKNELETRFVIISLMSSGYLSSDAYCPIVTVIYIHVVFA